MTSFEVWHDGKKLNSFEVWINGKKKTGRGRILLGLIAIPLGLGLVVGLVALGGYVLTWLWNETVTEIFETNPITFWQAVMLLVLCKILFGNSYNVKQTKEESKSRVREESEEGLGSISGVEDES